MEFCASHRAAYEKLNQGAAFKLPKGWAWATVDDITELKRGKYITRSMIKDGTIPVILGGQEPAYYCNESNHNGPCVVVSRSGASAGYASYWNEPIFVTDGFLFECHPSCTTRYFFYWLRSLPLSSLQRGTGIPHVRSENLKALPFPLPPHTEQKRIVARIEELFKMVESLGEAANRLEVTAKRLDKKILDLAIRGKLVPQNPNDEPASELLKRIAHTSHKSPCKNQEPPIGPPFEIPESWEWAKLGTISNYGHCRSVDAQSISADTWSLDLEEIEKDTGRLIVRKTAADKKSASSKHLFCKAWMASAHQRLSPFLLPPESYRNFYSSFLCHHTSCNTQPQKATA